MIALIPPESENLAVKLSPLLQAALLTLEYMDTSGPIELTPSKALKRYFVEWAAEAFAWPKYTAADLYSMNKVLNEVDFPPLVVLHDLLVGLKLARHYKGAMQISKWGTKVRHRPGVVLAVLAERLLHNYDLSQHTRFGDTVFGNWDIFFNVINVEAHGGCSDDHLCQVLYGSSKERDGIAHSRTKSAFYVHVLRPLVWLGLLQEHTVGDGLERERIYTKTPLWAVALKLETDRHLPVLVVN